MCILTTGDLWRFSSGTIFCSLYGWRAIGGRNYDWLIGWKHRPLFLIIRRVSILFERLSKKHMASNLTVFLCARGFHLHSRARLSCVDEWRVPDYLVKGNGTRHISTPKCFRGAPDTGLLNYILTWVENTSVLMKFLLGPGGGERRDSSMVTVVKGCTCIFQESMVSCRTRCSALASRCAFCPICCQTLEFLAIVLPALWK